MGFPKVYRTAEAGEAGKRTRETPGRSDVEGAKPVERLTTRHDTGDRTFRDAITLWFGCCVYHL